jgi:hypothetical protein
MVRYYLLLKVPHYLGLFFVLFVIEKVVVILLVTNYFGQVPVVVVILVDLMLYINLKLFWIFYLMTFYCLLEHLPMVNS